MQTKGFLETADVGGKDALDNKTGTREENRSVKVFASIHDMEQVWRVSAKPKDDIINDVKKVGQLRME